MKIDSLNIGINHRPLIVAELSGNHNLSLDRAIALVDASAESGVQALKLQTYTADTMTLNISEGEFFIDDKESLWEGKTLYQLYKEAYTPWEWHEPIMRQAKKLGMLCFSTPFDDTAVDFLEDLDVPCYKIASFENTDIPLIKRVAATGKPMMISTGMATESELRETMQAVHDAGGNNVVLLKCTSRYPAMAEDANVLTIPHIRSSFNCEVGLSDHTMGVGAAVAAVAHGAVVIEKHFTLNRADGGVDSAFSMEPLEMERLVIETRQAWQALGRIQYGPTKNEQPSLQYKRSIYVVNDIKAGSVFTEENLRCIRPGFGLPPKHYESLLGQIARCNLKRGTPLSWNLVE